MINDKELLVNESIQPWINSDLLEAAKDLIERWDTPLWKDAPATASYINKLREAVIKATGEQA